MSENLAIDIKGLKKQYRLGQIGGGTLTADLQSWWARVRHKEDPNTKIGTDQRLIGQTFMALNGIDLQVKQGEALGIIGGNGAGKSTMLKILSRITAPTEGTVDIYGRIASMLEVGTGFSGEMTGRENVYMNGAILGMTKAEIDAKMEDIIEFSEVREFIDTPVKRYSSGMYVKLAFSVAAHLDSEIMIMDEVLAVGDMAFQKKCLDKMRDAATVEGKTVLYVSHNMNTIRKLCDRCVVLDKGRIIFDGDVEEAISIYLGKTVEAVKKVKFGSNNHETWCKQKLFVHEAEIQNSITEIYAGDVLELRVRYEAKKKAENIRARLVVLDDKDEILGMSISSEELSFDEGQTGVLQFSLDTTVLAAGKYNTRISFFEMDQFGNHEYICVINQFLYFVLQDKPELHCGMNWSAQSWGHVALPAFNVEVLQ